MKTEILKLMLYNGQVSPDELEWVIFDEIHYNNDNDRGHVWEEVLIPHQVKILMLGATAPNCLGFADWVGRIKNRKIHVQTLYCPVPLRHHLYFGIDKNTRNCCYEIMGPNDEFLNKIFVKLEKKQLALWKQPEGQVHYFNNYNERGQYIKMVLFLKEQNLLPVVVFIFSRKNCNKFSNQLCQSIDLTVTQKKAAIRELFEKDLVKGSDRDGLNVIRVEGPEFIKIDKTSANQKCLCCGKEAKVLPCSGCMMAKYCSKECQKFDWTELNHKGICKHLKSFAKFM
uniref:MYND-type domain-containing protein n=1 Tax=Panagrolaimus sp. PS1159 TaxID=55785 RepID=A0AC35GM89_9BILA